MILKHDRLLKLFNSIIKLRYSWTKNIKAKEKLNFLIRVMIFFHFDIKFKKTSLSGKNSLITIEKADKLPENPDNFKNF